MDSGTSVILGPYDEVAAIHEVIGGFEVLPGLGEWIILCNRIDDMPDISFTLNGKDYVLTPQDYVLQV